MKLIAAVIILAAPLQASEWSLGVDLPLDQGGTSLWNTGEKWGYGITLGGPIVSLGCCDDSKLYYSLGSLTVQRFTGKMFCFGEIGYKIRGRDSHYEAKGGFIKMRAGAGISRKYKDFGVLISYGFGYEGWDGDGIYERVGLDAYPRVVVHWTL